MSEEMEPISDNEPRPLPIENWNRDNTQYHEFKCTECGETTRNTYVEPSRSQMLERRLCFICNYWHNFEGDLERNHPKMTIIGGHVYGPGNRTSGEFRGMAGRRFDIEYIEPSIHAGKRITTFDLWSGSQMPERLVEKYPDTARFIGGAEKVELIGGTKRCWNPSDSRSEPYPLPRSIGMG